jgi:hypothetical protein
MRQSDGSESPAFSLNIGPLYGRTTSTGTWELKPQKALSFRLVGTPLGTVDVPPTSLGRSPLHLAVSPNPSRGLSFVNWSGAEGSTRIELLDPSGRQVGVQTAVSGSSGRWACSARGADGRALPAGVYFVRAIDSIGKTAVSRLVLVP